MDLSPWPALEGRFVWADSGEPYVEGCHYSKLNLEGFGIGGLIGIRVGSDGRFRIPIHQPLQEIQDLSIDGWHELWEGPRGIELSEVLGERAVQIRLEAVSKDAVPERHVFEVAGGAVSTEIGDILVRRIPTLEVRTLGRSQDEWIPIEAGVRSSRGAIKTGEDGRGTLRFWPGDSLEILATGFDLTRVSVPQDLGSNPLEIRLEPTPTLDVIVPKELLDPTGRHQPQVKLAYSQTPFGSWNDAAAPPTTMTHAMYMAYLGPFVSGPSKLQNGSMLIPAPSSGAVRIPGLRRGASFQLSLTDAQGGLYTTRTIAFDEPMTVDDWGRDIATAYLEIHFQDSSSAEGLAGHCKISTDTGFISMEFKAGKLQTGPLAPGVFALRARYLDAAGKAQSREFENIEITAGRNQRTFDLAID